MFGPYAKFLVEEIGGECTSMAGEQYRNLLVSV